MIKTCDESFSQLGQDFECPSSINLLKFSESRLCNVTKVPASSSSSTNATNEKYPLIVRMERLSVEAIAKGDKLPEPPGSPLPNWVQAQTTYCILEKRKVDNITTYVIKCVKQKIMVEGTSYELKEIYGIEKAVGNRVNHNNSSSSDTSSNDYGTMLAEKENDEGTECVICLSEPKTTTVFPCRHLCMCRDCAKLLASQSNRCPVCRAIIEGMLEIKVKDSADKQQAEKIDERTKNEMPEPSTST